MLDRKVLVGIAISSCDISFTYANPWITDVDDILKALIRVISKPKLLCCYCLYKYSRKYLKKKKMKIEVENSSFYLGLRKL